MNDKWEKLWDLGSAFTGKRITVDRHLVQTPAGHRFPYEIANVRNAVAVLPITEAGNVVLLKNYRYPVQQTLIEVCAGLIDPGEDVLAAALRELEEETGYSAENWTFMGQLVTSPGWCTETIFSYVARDLVKGEQRLEAAEQGLEVIEMTLDAALMAVYNQEITDLKTSQMLMKYELMRQQGRLEFFV